MRTEYDGEWVLKVQRIVTVSEPTLYLCRVVQGLDAWLSGPIMKEQNCSALSAEGEVLGDLIVKYSRKRLNPNVFPDYPWDAARFIILEKDRLEMAVSVGTLLRQQS